MTPFIQVKRPRDFDGSCMCCGGSTFKLIEIGNTHGTVQLRLCEDCLAALKGHL